MKYFVCFLIALSAVAFAFSSEEESEKALGGTCGGNCPGGGCNNCVCGTTPSPQDIDAWCAQHSWNQRCCQCIVRQESAGNANAMNANTRGSFDVGLWQINSVHWPTCNAGKAPCNTTDNLDCAKQVYRQSANTWRPWTTCRACGCCTSH